VLHTIPPIPIDTKGLDISPLNAQVVEDTAAFSEGGDFGYNIDVMTTDVFNEALYNGVQSVFTDQATPEEVAASLEEAAQQ
jgi:raffinose/stachyose/melibiose transport system substrate-binding protein